MNRVAVAAKPAVTYNGRICALPLDLAGRGVIFNKELFTKAGISAPPATVAELKVVIEKLKAIDLIPFGVAFKEEWTLRHMFAMGQAAIVEPIPFAGKMNEGNAHFWNSRMNKAFETFDLILYKDEEDLKRLLELLRIDRADDDYHRELGRLYGYGEEEIEDFVRELKDKGDGERK